MPAPSSRSIAAAFGLTVATILVPAASANALSKVDADFAKYCRTKFNNSAYTRRGTRHYCNQGGTLQGVDNAEACRLTTGSRRYEVSGYRVLCLKPAHRATRPGSRAAGEPDFRRYCRTRFPNSQYLRRVGRETHLCSRPGATGGRTLQHVDLAEACRMTYGTRRYRRIAGDRVVCVGKGRATRVPGLKKACRSWCAMADAWAQFNCRKYCRGR